MGRAFIDWTPDDEPGEVVDVTDPAGWALLRDTYTGPKPNLPFERLVAIAIGHGVRSVVVERRYIDLDYRSEHSHFYSTTFRRYPSVCHRLHFFTCDVPDDLQGLDALDDEYRGYSVMRPMPTSPVGRTMISPPADLDHATVCGSHEVVHLFGYPMTVWAMPFMSQDAQYLRCAHAAQWMVLQHAHLFYGMPRRLPTDIHDASMGGVVIGRQVPSDGLSLHQMLVGLQRLGLSPASLRLPATRADSLAAGHMGLFPILCRYVNSDMPPIVISDQHAWVVVGYVHDGPGPGHDHIVLYRHDDAMGPYIPVPDPWTEPHPAHTPWSFALPPLPPKLYLSAERAEPIGRYWLSAAGSIDASSPIAVAEKAGRLSFRTYALPSHEFKQGSAGRLPTELERLYRLANWPRFVWVVEAIDRDLLDADQDCVLGEAILDPTAHHETEPDDPLSQAVIALHCGDFAIAESPDFAQSRVVNGLGIQAYPSFRRRGRR